MPKAARGELFLQPWDAWGWGFGVGPLWGVWSRGGEGAGWVRVPKGLPWGQEKPRPCCWGWVCSVPPPPASGGCLWDGRASPPVWGVRGYVAAQALPAPWTHPRLEFGVLVGVPASHGGVQAVLSPHPMHHELQGWEPLCGMAPLGAQQGQGGCLSWGMGGCPQSQPAEVQEQGQELREAQEASAPPESAQCQEFPAGERNP